MTEMELVRLGVDDNWKRSQITLPIIAIGAVLTSVPVIAAVTLVLDIAVTLTGHNVSYISHGANR